MSNPPPSAVATVNAVQAAIANLRAANVPYSNGYSYSATQLAVAMLNNSQPVQHTNDVEDINSAPIPEGWILPTGNHVILPGDDQVYGEEEQVSNHIADRANWHDFNNTQYARQAYRLFTSETAWSRAYNQFGFNDVRFVVKSGHYVITNSVYKGDSSGWVYIGEEKVHCILLTKAEYDVWNTTPAGLIADLLVGEPAQRRRTRYDHG